MGKIKELEKKNLGLKMRLGRKNIYSCGSTSVKQVIDNTSLERQYEKIKKVRRVIERENDDLLERLKSREKRASKSSAGKKDNNDMVDETVILKPFNEGQKNTHAQGGTQGDDDEEEDDGHPHGQRVQCQQ